MDKLVESSVDHYGRFAVNLQLTSDIRLILDFREGDDSPYVLLETVQDEYDIDGENLWGFVQSWRVAYDHWKKLYDEKNKK